MIDKTKNEAQAIEYAALMASEVINEQIGLGMIALQRWDRDAYHAVIEAAITAFVERMQELKGVADA